MWDELEQFVEEHRDELDMQEPPEHLWNNIQKRLPAQHRRSNSGYYALAASILLIISAGIWMMRPANTRQQAQPVAMIPAMAPEILEAESYYATAVSASREQLGRYCNQYPGLCSDFKKEIDTLNVLYGQLKTEYSASEGNEAVLQAMIENLQTQVDLLKRQLHIVQSINKGNKISKT